MKTPAEYFDRIAREYDDLILRAVPVYELMLSELERALPARADGVRRVVELGAGTGNASVVVGRAFPDATLVLVDAAEEMLDVARARLARELPDRPGAIEPSVARFEELALEPESVDLVVSSIALHHVADKPPLFARVHEWLRPGGELVVLDQMAGAGPRTDALVRGRYRSFYRRHCTPEEVAHLDDHEARHDHHEPLGNYLDAARAAGFRDVDCVWRTAMWAIVTGTR